eukprot:3184534-Rhodomonas_salina.1
MTPRLLTTVVRVCAAVDRLFAHGPAPTPVPAAPKEWAVRSRVWRDSGRCGTQTLRFDANFAVISGVHVNRFWSDLAGLHREEFVSRALAGESRFPTSELRQTVKLFDYFRRLLRARLQA